ncbi:MAG: hypothetical protein IJA72_05190 [Clostridia bacterium]|nr:hypothetical protein [Clostridia bacterium]
MAKERIFSKIVSSFKHLVEGDIEMEDKAEIMPDFVVPSGEVLTLLQNHKPLTMWQINEVLNYIKSNYYFCDNKSILDDFAFEWTVCAGDIDEIRDRMENACAEIVADLSIGKRINPANALWVSSKIYADDLISDKRRIISKKLYSNCAIFDVESQAKNPQIEKEMHALRTQLNVNNYTKTFANIL